MNIKGSELTTEQIHFINHAWKNQWGEKVDQLKDPSDYVNDIFFFLYDNDIVAIARLIPLKITFINKEYDVLGISKVLSIVQGKGYGGKIVTEIKDYVEDLGMTAIGFCSKKDFYKKFGYGIIEDAMSRFLFNGEGKYFTSNLLYIKGKDDFIEQFISNPNEEVSIPIGHW